MRNAKLRFAVSLLLAAALAMTPMLGLAHGGRTDSRGGHRDKKNKSGLGSYHYHCGGASAHLHEDGVCPYAPKASTRSKASASASSGVSDLSAASPSGAGQGMDEAIQAYVRQGVIQPSGLSDAAGGTVSILLGRAKKTVNVRQKPDADGKKLGYLRDGDQIMVIQSYYAPKWHQILYDGQIGYVSAQYCDLTDTVVKTVQIPAE